jgi:hypothetical protein
LFHAEISDALTSAQPWTTSSFWSISQYVWSIEFQKSWASPSHLQTDDKTSGNQPVNRSVFLDWQ